MNYPSRPFGLGYRLALGLALGRNAGTLTGSQTKTLSESAQNILFQPFPNWFIACKLKGVEDRLCETERQRPHRSSQGGRELRNPSRHPFVTVDTLVQDERCTAMPPE
jgi:hypothetical protein